MNISKIKLENFGLFENLEVELWSNFQPDEKVTIFIGENGSGKSTILEGIALLLSHFIDSLKNETHSGSQIPELKIKTGSSFSNLEIIVCDGDDEKSFFSWNISKAKKGMIKNIESNLKQLHTLTTFYRSNYTERENTSLPLIAYYPTERNVLDIPKRFHNHNKFKQINGYDTSLNTYVNFRPFFEWIKDNEDYRNEKKISLEEIAQYINFEKISQDKNKNSTEILNSILKYIDYERIKNEDFLLYEKIKNKQNFTNDPQYNSVLRALEIFLPGYSGLRIQRRPQVQILINKGKEVFDILQLSQGEKSLIALAGDIARRLAIMNPALSNPLEGKGIVLIDEIDLHLHPAWQRSVVRNLRKTFPNCQFILTTHSPIVVTDPEKIRVYSINKNNIERLPHPYGTDIEDFLLENMNTPLRNEELQEKLDSLFKAIENKSYDNYVSIKKDLLSTISSKNSELIRADLYYKRQRALDEKNK